jgi:hypothetical protein
MSAARDSSCRIGSSLDVESRDPTANDVGTLLPPVDAVDALAAALLPGFIAGLAALQARAAARLALPVVSPPAATERPKDDMVTEVREVASTVRRSVSWVRRHGHMLPGFSQPGGKGCKVSWSRRALETWIAGENSPLTGARGRA